MSYGDSPDTLDYIEHLEVENERLRDKITRLKAQLTWRPVSEKPEKEGKYWLRRGESNISVLLYKDGSWWYFDNDIRNEYVEFNFKYAGKYAPTHWLPIPPAPEVK